MELPSTDTNHWLKNFCDYCSKQNRCVKQKISEFDKNLKGTTLYVNDQLIEVL